MRTIRGKDSKWEMRRYRGDIAIYAHCKCGFEYACSSNYRNEDGTWSFRQIITKLYHYCPYCGSHKKTYNKEPILMEDYIWRITS